MLGGTSVQAVFAGQAGPPAVHSAMQAPTVPHTGAQVSPAPQVGLPPSASQSGSQRLRLRPSAEATQISPAAQSCEPPLARLSWQLCPASTGPFARHTPLAPLGTQVPSPASVVLQLA